METREKEWRRRAENPEYRIQKPEFGYFATEAKRHRGRKTIGGIVCLISVFQRFRFRPLCLCVSVAKYPEIGQQKSPPKSEGFEENRIGGPSLLTSLKHQRCSCA